MMIMMMMMMMNICVMSGFYAESPDDDDVGDDDDRRSCDGPCASADSDAGRPTICNVQRDHPTEVYSADDQLPSGTGTGTLDDWPLTMLSSGGGTVSKTVLGRFRLLLLLLLLTGSLSTRCCAVILYNVLIFSINCLVHVRLIRCLPDSFVNR